MKSIEIISWVKFLKDRCFFGKCDFFDVYADVGLVDFNQVGKGGGGRVDNERAIVIRDVIELIFLSEEVFDYVYFEDLGSASVDFQRDLILENGGGLCANDARLMHMLPDDEGFCLIRVDRGVKESKALNIKSIIRSKGEFWWESGGNLTRLFRDLGIKSLFAVYPDHGIRTLIYMAQE